MKDILSIDINNKEVNVIEAKVNGRTVLDKLIVFEIPSEILPEIRPDNNELLVFLGKKLSENSIKYNNAAILLRSKNKDVRILKTEKNASVTDIKTAIKSCLPPKSRHVFDFEVIENERYKYVLWVSYERKYFKAFIDSLRKIRLVKSFSIARSISVKYIENFALAATKLFYESMQNVNQGSSCALVYIQKNNILIAAFDGDKAPLMVKNIDISFLEEVTTSERMADIISVNIKEAVSAIKNKIDKYYLSVDLRMFENCKDNLPNSLIFKMICDKLPFIPEKYNALRNIECPPQYFNARYLEYIKDGILPALGAVLMQKKYKKSIVKGMAGVFNNALSLFFISASCLIIAFGIFLNSIINAKNTELEKLRNENEIICSKISERENLKIIYKGNEMPDATKSIYGILHDFGSLFPSNAQIIRIKINSEGNISILGLSNSENDIEHFVKMAKEKIKQVNFEKPEIINEKTGKKFVLKAVFAR